ncbi:hypothetical protein NECAME_14251 [Necator americanus]|uniref:Uncharacterized protein n=1 Tax=Necator americanus TaxID=51031 RepID=W2SRL9_NECAM|nr:hypothetical protein NECAME_14251 [Necator americanus]ETN71332.1 hypothetical protein NECAME_14251 [Necator americanus]
MLKLWWHLLQSSPQQFSQILAPISRRCYEPIEIWSGARGRELQLDTATVEASFSMRIGDLKRAVEDVILRPDQNTLNDIDKRDTIAALDLCQPEPSPPLPTCTPSAASMNACSCSSETVPVDVPRPPPPLCTSTSLDTIVRIEQKLSTTENIIARVPGTSVSLPPSARQTPMRFGDEDAHRSSLGSSDSHSSVARSEDYSQDYVAEEDETVIYQYTSPETALPPTARTATPVNFNPYLTYRETRDDEAMECD